jgi:hypothetical protein
MLKEKEKRLAIVIGVGEEKVRTNNSRWTRVGMLLSTEEKKINHTSNHTFIQFHFFLCTK